MLTGKHIRVRFVRDQVVPWYLDPQDDQWLQLADQLVTLYRASAGRARGEIEAEIDELFGSLPQPAIHQGFAKLLEDRCDFETLPGTPPAELRAATFRAAARVRQADAPGFTRQQVLEEVAA